MPVQILPNPEELEIKAFWSQESWKKNTQFIFPKVIKGEQDVGIFWSLEIAYSTAGDVVWTNTPPT